MSEEKPSENRPSVQKRAEERGFSIIEGDNTPDPEFSLTRDEMRAAFRLWQKRLSGKAKSFPITDHGPPPTPLELYTSSLKDGRNEESGIYDTIDLSAFSPEPPKNILRDELKRALYADGVRGWTNNVAEAGFALRVLKGKAGYEGVEAIIKSIITVDNSQWNSHCSIKTEGDDVVVQVSQKLFDAITKYECVTAQNEAKSR